MFTLEASKLIMVLVSNSLVYMVGWFSLNVPSGLTLYWITNNILSTGQQVYLKRSTKAPEFKPLGTVVNPVVDVEDRVTGKPRSGTE